MIDWFFLRKLLSLFESPYSLTSTNILDSLSCLYFPMVLSRNQFRTNIFRWIIQKIISIILLRSEMVFHSQFVGSPCPRNLIIQSFIFWSVQSILSNNLYTQPACTHTYRLLKRHNIEHHLFQILPNYEKCYFWPSVLHTVFWWSWAYCDKLHFQKICFPKVTNKKTSKF